MAHSLILQLALDQNKRNIIKKIRIIKEVHRYVNIQTWMNAVLLLLCLHPAFVWLSQIAPPLQYNYSGQIPAINYQIPSRTDETLNVTRKMIKIEHWQAGKHFES